MENPSGSAENALHKSPLPIGRSVGTLNPKESGVNTSTKLLSELNLRKRIAIIAGGVVYVLMIIAGGFYFRLDIDVVTLIIYTVISVVIGLLLEFFVFGGDYTRTERLEYEDDEYYYYVKAVPKACVTTSERSIKKINGSSAKDERPAQDNVVSYANPIFHGDEKAVTTDEAAAPVERKKDIDSVDFEKKLEESLKNL